MRWCVVMIDGEREPETVYGPFDTQLEATEWGRIHINSKRKRLFLVVEMEYRQPAPQE